MKKLFFILLLALNAYAFNVEMASKVFDKLFVALIQKTGVKVLVHTKDAEYFKVISLAKNLELVDTVSDADIVLVNKKANLPRSDVPIFTTDIQIYHKNENALGVFFWQHGRPKIIFSKERLQNFDILLDPQWSKYIQSTNKKSFR